jgi:hypothetical protein
MRLPDLRPLEATGSIMGSISEARLFFVAEIAAIPALHRPSLEILAGHGEPTSLARQHAHELSSHFSITGSLASDTETEPCD